MAYQRRSRAQIHGRKPGISRQKFIGIGTPAPYLTGGAQEHGHGQPPQRQPQRQPRQAGGRRHLDKLVMGAVMGLGRRRQTLGVASEHDNEIFRAPAQQRAFGKSPQPGLPGRKPAAYARPLRAGPYHPLRVGAGPVEKALARAGAGQRQYYEQNGGRAPPAAARQDGYCQRGKTDRRTKPDVGAHRIGQHQSQKMQPRQRRPEHGRPAQAHGMNSCPRRRAPRPRPIPAQAGIPVRRGTVRRDIPPPGYTRRPGPQRKPGRQHQVQQHVDAEIDRIAEGPAEPRQVLLRQCSHDRDVDAAGAGDDHAGHDSPGHEVGAQQCPPFTGPAQQ